MAKITFDELLESYDPIEIKCNERFRDYRNDDEIAYKVACEGESLE